MKCGKWAVVSGKEICSEEYSDLTEQEVDYIFMRRRGPITVSKLHLYPKNCKGTPKYLLRFFSMESLKFKLIDV
jgi:hypothetical protein